MPNRATKEDSIRKIQLTILRWKPKGAQHADLLAPLHHCAGADHSQGRHANHQANRQEAQ